ncbi:hypothetical protein TBLA_0F03060 [Henningerozyma blattae CBS 6284]|uniref:Glutamate pyruvate transaminase n=1 Tax=Henningerozyma blattae (strain ATCC 34711 / CBS 6284 / DSM 70876 / NBRC 10599 / NRRL Y-10934 / UCD 77-7) TaxID=1071380 RepID=I2H643_HENB6|nr:hypothetical protein TBLA_0F03060 [Tetrapisispora blattae CBS 6284]CCH61845.1 hypothetical protein TBLA_0F03060 [Tetrapisispora blattae CBS 6284]
MTMNQKTFLPAPKFSLNDINESILKAEYAIRGTIPNRAEELDIQLLENSKSLPFAKIVYANIGNPQQLDQQPLTFQRQVMSLVQFPDLLKSKDILLAQKIYSKDSIERATKLLNSIGGSVGAYSSSQGVLDIRKNVARFILKRDLHHDPTQDLIDETASNVFLTAGASTAVDHILPLFAKDESCGVLLPIPQYPLYTAAVTLQKSKLLPYYLNESNNWSTDPKQIEQIVIDAIKQNIKPTTLVVINPGNPTGAILTKDSIIDIIDIAAEYGIVIIADEVYQENVYEAFEFHSFKKVLSELRKNYPSKYDNVQLASLHSISKGVNGECGQRGGYMEITGFSNDVKKVLLKVASISICSVVTGQILVDLMVNPPQPGDESYELDQLERSVIHSNLILKSNTLYDVFTRLPGISCQKPQGAMYLFPRLHLSENAINAATELNLKPDEFYCLKLLENTGICTVPGSGFGQYPGTYHLRTTFLPPGIEWINSWEKFHLEFMEKYK